MKKFNFNAIPKFCISLKKSVDRKKSVSKEFEKQGLDVVFFEAIDKKNLIVPELSIKKQTHPDDNNLSGVLACAMSHVELIKKAKELNLPAICIFEDDVVFCDDFKERIEYLENLKEFEFDFLCLGGHFEKEVGDDAKKTQWQYIHRVKRMGGTYAYVITEKCYDYIIRNWNYNYGADEFYGNHVYRQFKSYAFVPFLVGCAVCKSEITEVCWEYKNIAWYYQQGPVIQNVKQLIKETNENVKPIPLEELRPLGEKEINDLRDTTFIIPVRIESDDREFNFMRVIAFLCDNFATNIIIKESDNYSKCVELLKRIDKKRVSITHVFEQNDSSVFHRTRLLNEMISMVRTPVCVNYDIDVFMKQDTYIKARNRVLNDGYDLVYPYGQGTSQYLVDFPEKHNYAGQSLFDERYLKEWGSLCGHCQFFNTRSYIEGGMENEEFVSYGAEDVERMERFIKLGYKVTWTPDTKIYHIEHSRGPNSSPENPHFIANENLMLRFRNMEAEEVKNYYDNVSYIQKYK